MARASAFAGLVCFLLMPLCRKFDRGAAHKSYTLMQWLLVFFIYCFLGWVLENCYVSFRQRMWVNRGFLYGPWLPIYGFGAIIILFLTLPVRESPGLVYILETLGPPHWNMSQGRSWSGCSICVTGITVYTRSILQRGKSSGPVPMTLRNSAVKGKS